jgi:hypothetical protein
LPRRGRAAGRGACTRRAARLAVVAARLQPDRLRAVGCPGFAAVCRPPALETRKEGCAEMG